MSLLICFFLPKLEPISNQNFTLTLTQLFLFTMTGPNCTRPTTSSSTFPRPKTQESHNEAQSGTIFGVIITLALSVVVIFAIVYYRRRIKRLKSELSHVPFIADPGPTAGKLSLFCTRFMTSTEARCFYLRLLVSLYYDYFFPIKTMKSLCKNVNVSLFFAINTILSKFMINTNPFYLDFFHPFFSIFLPSFPHSFHFSSLLPFLPPFFSSITPFFLFFLPLYFLAIQSIFRKRKGMSFCRYCLLSMFYQGQILIWQNRQHNPSKKKK